MKKPKRKPVRHPSPKAIAVVDPYAHVEMPHRINLEAYYSKEIDVMYKWCEDTFTVGTFRKIGIWPAYMCFVRDKDAMFFTLRWSR